ncbi:hypothetical protein ACJ72_00427 [Emergomyces africanus]|uniref:Uncharacterized protein n=1 Tax=Emergomyces africanus TaxID=1955775 RepID=A0A1B7P877_9EURO|nr:hypothetical protein ACJ72_00427 [Emergomyces africanus]
MASRTQKDSVVLREPSLPIASARLETEYEKTLCQAKLIIGNEQNRILRVHALLADHDKEDLYCEIEETKWHLERAEKIGREAQEQLKQAQNDIDYLRNSLRVQLREIDDLKASIQTRRSADSSKLLAEKRAMTREISNLKDEINHLKTQNLSHQALMSDKLSLERQLRSLEVEFQREKNALEKARLKAQEQSEVENKISAELGELNKELARERREREKIENDMKTEALEWTRHRTVLENKLSALRNKLRQSKDTIDLDHVKVLDDAGSSLQADLRRKRSASKFESDITITTPGAAAAARKISRVPTEPGEKSIFSTTPFLNRTRTTAESSDLSESDSSVERARKSSKRFKEDGEHDRPKPRKPSNSKATKATNQKRQAQSQNMVNSDDDHNVTQPPKPQNESSTSNTNKNVGIKRRLLPKKPEGTLFDDDDGFGDSNKDRRRVPSGFRALGPQFGLGAPGRRIGGGRGLDAYAEISPLRRDIRAAKN